MQFVTFFSQSDVLSDGCAFGLKPLKKDVSQGDLIAGMHVNLC